MRYLNETGPVVLFMDGHASHLGLKVIQKAKKKNIHLIAVPAHTTHITQPLDVGLFGPMKSTWRAINDDLRRKTTAAVVDKAIFPSLVAQLWDCKWSKALIGCFYKTGIFPFSPYAIPNEKLSPSKVFSDDKDDDSQQVLNDSSPDTDVEITFKGTVTITPTRPMVKTYIKKHFTKVLQGAHDQKRKPKGAVERKKLGLTHYGKALTSDEVFFRLREQAAKKSKAATTVTASKLKKAKKHKMPLQHVLLRIVNKTTITAKVVNSPLKTTVTKNSPHGSVAVRVGDGIFSGLGASLNCQKRRRIGTVSTVCSLDQCLAVNYAVNCSELHNK